MYRVTGRFRGYCCWQIQGRIFQPNPVITPEETAGLLRLSTLRLNWSARFFLLMADTQFCLHVLSKAVCFIIAPFHNDLSMFLSMEQEEARRLPTCYKATGECKHVVKS